MFGLDDREDTKSDSVSGSLVEGVNAASLTQSVNKVELEGSVVPVAKAERIVLVK